MAHLIIQSFTMYGLVIVISMLAACLIKLIVTVLARAEDRKAARFPVTKAVAPVADGGIPPEHVAAITAAVYSVLGTHRIVHISDGRSGSNWSLEGKLLNQTSHAIHRKSR